MFKTLLKTRLAAFGAYYSGAGRRRGGKKQAGAGRKVLYALLFLYCFVAFGGMFFGLFSVLAEAFAGTSYAWLYFVMYAIVSFALMFIGSVFTAKTQLLRRATTSCFWRCPCRRGTSSARGWRRL